MRFPLDEKIIGSGYRFKQKTWYKTLHLGTDWVAKLAPLYAPTDGEVIKAIWGPQGGNWLYFRDSAGYTHRFGHLNSFIVKSGKVKEGALLAITGNTGSYTSGYHLHHDITKPGLEVDWNDVNRFIDPEEYFKNSDNKMSSEKSTKGIDVSHYQGNIDWQKVKTNGIDFVIMKATEGTTFIDQKLKQNQKEARAVGLLTGYYHFARGGDAVKEADFFIDMVGKLQEGELLVLDWEISHNKPAEWCLLFLEQVKLRTDIKPLLYTNEARVKSIDWSLVIKGDYGLWVARYFANNGEIGGTPSCGQWPFFVIHQYTSRGKVAGISGNVDMNVATTTLETLKKYGKKGEDSSANVQPDYEKNLLKIFSAVCKKYTIACGEKPNDNETEIILSKLKNE